MPDDMIEDTATAVAIEQLRGEMKLGFADVRGDVRETQRLQRETNGRVSEHDSAIAGILKREACAAQQRRDRALIVADRLRIVRFAYRTWGVATTNRFVVRAGVSAVLVILLAEARGWF